MLKVSDFLILIKSCFIESRNDPSPKSEMVHETEINLKIYYLTHVCLVHLERHQTCKQVMVSIVSSSARGGNFIFLDTSMLILYKNVRNVRFMLFTKSSNIVKPEHRFRRKTRLRSNSFSFIIILLATVRTIFSNFSLAAGTVLPFNAQKSRE